MRFVRLLIILLVTLLTSSRSVAYSAESQLILKAKMVSVAAFDKTEVVDALDVASAEGTLPTATVVFKINSIVKGSLPLKKVQSSASLGSQMKDSVKEKNLLQVITMDYENPEVEHEGKPRWFALGVQSPLELFNVISWKDLPAEPYRLTFSKSSDDAGWTLISAEKS